MKPALCLLLAFPFLSLAQQTAPADSNHVVAVVEGMSWTAADLEQMTSALGGAIQMNFRSSPKAFLETFGLLLKLQQIADEEKLSESDPHKWRLLYNRALYLAQVRMNDQGTRTPITPEELQKYYDEHKQEFARARTRAILIAVNATRDQAAAEKLAAEVAGQARSGADFAALVKRYSDDAESKAKGGDYPLIKPDDTAFPPAAKTAVFALKPGQSTDPVRQPSGFWIFRLEEYVVPPFDEVRSAIFLRIQDLNVKNWMESVRKSVRVEFKDPAYFEKIAARPAPVPPPEAAVMRVPDFCGAPLAVEYMPDPHAWRGRLISGAGPGLRVHAASFIRQRRIVLDAALLRHPREHRRILVHELFHFAWVRLGSPDRATWAALLAREIRARARGDLGWSAELSKTALKPDDLAHNHRRWRRYLSEAFCDTAAWLFAGIPRHSEFTLARRHRSARRAWFGALLRRRPALSL